VFIDILPVLGQLVRELLLQVDAPVAGLRQAINRIPDEVETVEIVEHRHIERRGDRAFFLVAAHVDVVVIGAAVGEPVNQPWVGVKGEDDWLVPREQLVEIRVAQSVRVFALGLQPHEVNDVDDADFQFGQMLAQEGNSGERLHCGQWARLRLAVINHTGDDQIGIVEYRSEGMAEGVAQLAAFVNRAGIFRRRVAGNASGKRELQE